MNTVFKRYPLIAAFLLVFVWLNNSCKKEEPEETPDPPIPAQTIGTDSLSDELENILSNLPDTLLRLEDMMMDNGMDVKAYLMLKDPGFLTSFPSGRTADLSGIQMTKAEQKYLFMARVATVGNYLVWDVNHQYPDEGADSPEQDGLAYSYGSKDFNIRQKPPVGACQDKKVYGLDCSGMLYQMLTISGLTGVEAKNNFTVTTTRDTAKWNAAFRNSVYDSLWLSDMGQLAIDSIRFGDVIYWPNAPHVGWCLGGRLIYQSNGSGNAANCSNNRTSTKGPRTVKLEDFWWTQAGAYRVFRIQFEDETVTDIDGNVYGTKFIGTQKWMTENLRTTRYADGSVIPEVTNDADWEVTTDGALCAYDNDIGNVADYGMLYNWYAVADPRNVCPVGWHVPSDAEWTQLIDFLGGVQFAGGKMKTTTGWLPPNTGATNESGFTGLPGGYRFQAGAFDNIGGYAYWWSSTQISTGTSSHYYLTFDESRADGFDNVKQTGVSVRCLRD